MSVRRVVRKASEKQMEETGGKAELRRYLRTVCSGCRRLPWHHTCPYSSASHTWTRPPPGTSTRISKAPGCSHSPVKTQAGVAGSLSYLWSREGSLRPFGPLFPYWDSLTQTVGQADIRKVQDTWSPAETLSEQTSHAFFVITSLLSLNGAVYKRRYSCWMNYIYIIYSFSFFQSQTLNISFSFKIVVSFYLYF